MTLENDALRIVLDPQTGGFKSIFDKNYEYEYIADNNRSLLFRLMVPQQNLYDLHIDSHSPSFKIADDTIYLKYCQQEIELNAEIELAGDRILCRLEINNHGESKIEEINFPYVRSLHELAGAEYVWPKYYLRKTDKLFSENLGGDHRTWDHSGQKMTARYPEYLAAAWCDYSNSMHGLALTSRHKDFSIVDFNVYKFIDKKKRPVERCLDIYTVCPTRILPGESKKLPEMQIVLHEGDWHKIADDHRKWLEGWIKKPDRPERFANSIGWHFFFMKHQEGHVSYTYQDLPRLADACRKAGCDYILLFGWQECGHDNDYLYGYYANEDWGGKEALRLALEEVRDKGVEVIPFFNGTLANIEARQHKEIGINWESRTLTGYPYYAGDWAHHVFDAPSPNRSMLHHQICPCTGFIPFWEETVERIIDYGFGNIHLDQIAEKMFVCYNELHSHEDPARAYVDGYTYLLQKTRQNLRQKYPEGVMLAEGINDFTGQWCDASWAWGHMANFPEPVLYTLPWLISSCEIDALDYDLVNICFVYKLHLDLKIGGGDERVDEYPDFAEFIRKRAELKTRIAEFYVDADFRDMEGIRILDNQQILARIYYSPRNTRGIVIAETQGIKTYISLDLDSKIKKEHIRIESSETNSSELGWQSRIRLDLEPYEIKVLCLY